MPDIARLLGEIEACASVLSPYWPLPQFVAVNPLHGLEKHPFEEAVAQAAQLFERPPAQGATEVANRHMIQALAAFLDQGQAAWPMPDRHLGLFRAWKRIARHDPGLPGRAALDALPDDPAAALAQLLEGLDGEARRAALGALLTALPGWASYVRWRAAQKEDPWQQRCPISLLDHVAVRAVLGHCLGEALPAAADQQPDEAPAPPLSAPDPAAEERFRSRLLGRLQEHAKRPLAPAVECDSLLPCAQLIFCIDVRSETLRRHLEAAGPYETLGFAGFFAIPMAVQSLDCDHAHAACPALLSPQHRVAERPRPGSEALLAALRARRAPAERLADLAGQLKADTAAPFALVEASGWLHGLRSLLATHWPRLGAAIRRRLLPEPPTELTIDPQPQEGVGIPLPQQRLYAEAALKTMGLTRDFAPLVVLCGHGGETRNNPYARALDCGACGGHAGGPNARALAAILNKADIRDHLRSRDIDIPETTRFLAAEHNTTTDSVRLLDPPDDAVLPEASARRLSQLRRDLRQAGSAAAMERCRHLTGATGDARAAVARRAADWSEVRPEWGLARNAAFIVGPRSLTRGLDLEGRCFLHSYDWHDDAAGKALELILTAPMVVAQWINAQYYFSTAAPDIYGAGSKTTHTVVGRFGVMQGNGSDLMTGLPLQSVWRADGQPFHETLRLTTVVQAPRQRVDAIIARNSVLQRLFDNGWVTLCVLDPVTGEWLERRRDGSWQTAAVAADPPTAAATTAAPTLARTLPEEALA